MFGSRLLKLFSRPNKSQRRGSNRVRLQLEALEGRDVPSAYVEANIIADTNPPGSDWAFQLDDQGQLWQVYQDRTTSAEPTSLSQQDGWDGSAKVVSVAQNGPEAAVWDLRTDGTLSYSVGNGWNAIDSGGPVASFALDASGRCYFLRRDGHLFAWTFPVPDRTSVASSGADGTISGTLSVDLPERVELDPGHLAKAFALTADRYDLMDLRVDGTLNYTPLIDPSSGGHVPLGFWNQFDQGVTSFAVSADTRSVWELKVDGGLDAFQAPSRFGPATDAAHSKGGPFDSSVESFALSDMTTQYFGVVYDLKLDGSLNEHIGTSYSDDPTGWSVYDSGVKSFGLVGDNSVLQSVNVVSQQIYELKNTGELGYFSFAGGQRSWNSLVNSQSTPVQSIGLVGARVFYLDAVGHLNYFDGSGLDYDAYYELRLAPAQPHLFAGGTTRAFAVANGRVWDLQTDGNLWVNDDPAGSDANGLAAGWNMVGNSVSSLAVAGPRVYVSTFGSVDPGQQILWYNDGQGWMAYRTNVAFETSLGLVGSRVYYLGSDNVLYSSDDPLAQPTPIDSNVTALAVQGARVWYLNSFGQLRFFDHGNVFVFRYGVDQFALAGNRLYWLSHALWTEGVPAGDKLSFTDNVTNTQSEQALDYNAGQFVLGPGGYTVEVLEPAAREVLRWDARGAVGSGWTDYVLGVDTIFLEAGGYTLAAVDAVHGRLVEVAA